MKLLLDIHQLRPNRFAYSIQADVRSGEAEAHYQSAFDSLEQCLRDAGDAIGHYFSMVSMRYEGREVGACLTESLRRQPRLQAERFVAAVAVGMAVPA